MSDKLKLRVKPFHRKWEINFAPEKKYTVVLQDMDILIYWYVDILIYWYIDILIYWYIDILIYWYIDILASIML